MRYLLLQLVILFGFSAHAITWGTTFVTDPISGKECEVQEPMSSGSYVYRWESKYDGVYWPFTDKAWLWHCPASGYVSFGNDFDELTASEIEKIRAFLKDNPQREGEDLFARVESIYKLRDVEDGFWAWFERLKAYRYQQLADQARMRAIPMLESRIKELEPGFELIQSYFVLGEYNRRMGQFPKALEAFSKAENVNWIDEDGNSQIGSDYINDLISERKRIMDAMRPR